MQSANAAKWCEIQESYDQTLEDNFKIWTQHVWSQWVRYKSKTVKRKQTTNEKKKDKGKSHILECLLIQGTATSGSSASFATREVPSTPTPPVHEQDTLALTPPQHRSLTNHSSGTPLSTPLRNLCIGYTTPASSSAIYSRRPLK